MMVKNRLETREIKGHINIAGIEHEVINEEMFCPVCKEWIDSLYWRLEVDEFRTAYTCGACDNKFYM